MSIIIHWEINGFAQRDSVLQGISNVEKTSTRIWNSDSFLISVRVMQMHTSA